MMLHRRTVLSFAFASLPGLALAQRPQQPQQPGARHDEVLGRDFDDLPAGARERVQNEFRQGSPDLGDDGIRQRWNAMTPEQRGESLTARERARPSQGSNQGRGPGAGPGTGQGPGGGQGRGQGQGRGGPPVR